MLINCVVYKAGNKLADIPIADISEYISQPECFVWVALQDATPEELVEMQHEFGLHPLAVEDARKGHQRPKIEEYGASLFAVLHLVEAAPDSPDGYNIGEVSIFTEAKYVLSIRNRSQQGFLGVRQRCESEPELLGLGPGFVLYALMDAVVDRYFPIIDALELELEGIEDSIFTKGAARENVERLYALKRRAMVLRHSVSPLLEGVGQLHSGRVPPVCSSVRDYFRDVHDHLARINGSIDSIRDTIGTAIQVNLSMVAIDETNVTKRLASWAAIFGVWTALAGIWGMNFEHMPELKWTYGYPLALFVIVTACSLLYWAFRRERWL